MIDNRELFTARSDDYSRFRPSYPDAAVSWLKAKTTTGSRVLDVGAGTGIFTRGLLAHFENVSAVEPNADMREKFRINLPQIPCSDGSGEATEMPDGSFDLITVAQAFHWLDAAKFKLEASRILRPGGLIAIIWNTSKPNDFTDERNRICQKYCPRFRAGHAGQHSVKEGDIFLRQKYFRKVEVATFDNPFTMDSTTFEGNTRSRSYALMPGDRDYPEFMAELRSVFEKYAVNGSVVEPQETQIYLGSF